MLRRADYHHDLPQYTDHIKWRIMAMRGSTPIGNINMSGSNWYTNVVPGQVHINIGGPTPKTQYGQISLAGTLVLGMTLKVELIQNYDPPAQTTFEIIVGNYFTTADFGGVTLPQLSGTKFWAPPTRVEKTINGVHYTVYTLQVRQP